MNDKVSVLNISQMKMPPRGKNIINTIIHSETIYNGKVLKLRGLRGESMSTERGSARGGAGVGWTARGDAGERSTSGGAGDH